MSSVACGLSPFSMVALGLDTTPVWLIGAAERAATGIFLCCVCAPYNRLLWCLGWSCRRQQP